MTTKMSIFTPKTAKNNNIPTTMFTATHAIKAKVRPTTRTEETCYNTIKQKTASRNLQNTFSFESLHYHSTDYFSRPYLYTSMVNMLVRFWFERSFLCTVDSAICDY